MTLTECSDWSKGSDLRIIDAHAPTCGQLSADPAVLNVCHVPAREVGVHSSRETVQGRQQHSRSTHHLVSPGLMLEYAICTASMQ